MRLDLNNIIYAPGSVASFSFEMDLSDLDFYGNHILSEPIYVTGEVSNRAEMLTFRATAVTTLHLCCDSCGKRFRQQKQVTVERMIVTELANEGDDDALDLIVLENNGLDVEALMRDEIILAIDTKNLCKEDCKGRCPKCGKDLNEGPCDCKPELDSRFAVLAKLLQQEE
jgi:uncharacterized protein